MKITPGLVLRLTGISLTAIKWEVFPIDVVGDLGVAHLGLHLLAAFSLFA